MNQQKLSETANAMVAPGPVNIGARISASTNLAEVNLTLNGQNVEPMITEQSAQVWLIGYTSRLDAGRHEVRLNAKDRDGRAVRRRDPRRDGHARRLCLHRRAPADDALLGLGDRDRRRRADAGPAQHRRQAPGVAVVMALEGLRVLDAVAQHRVIRLARFAFVLCQFSPAAGQQIVTPAGAEEGVLLRFGPHGIATR